MLVSHEVPKQLLLESRNFNDYDYALVHLFSKDQDYYNFYKESLKLNRIVYLDNSLFELEEMFNHDEFAKYVEELGSINPENFYYIIPDSLEEKDVTIESFKKFTKKYLNLPGKKIGVVQGKNFNELVECYEFMKNNADVVAISFDYSYYLESNYHTNKYKAFMLGRQNFIKTLIQKNIWDFNKKHHLLGCGLPQEFKFYKNINIYSVDTSNPVVHGIKNIKYKDYGLDTKESIKLVDLFNISLNEDMLKCINYNIKMFKKFIS